jgi:hypothetical protein
VIRMEAIPHGSSATTLHISEESRQLHSPGIARQ